MQQLQQARLQLVLPQRREREPEAQVEDIQTPEALAQAAIKYEPYYEMSLTNLLKKAINRQHKVHTRKFNNNTAKFAEEVAIECRLASQLLNVLNGTHDTLQAIVQSGDYSDVTDDEDPQE